MNRGLRSRMVDSPSSATKDRVIRVFVSSTFRDMVEDRNELMSHAWPALRRLCRARAVEFVEVDLRWGVTEEQAQRKEVVRHCLAEIRRCRPYFIGILGERYGWKPGPEAYSEALLNEEDWLKSEVAKHSVTELEIIHGVLRDPEQAKRSFFYFRDPKYARSRGADCLSEDHEKAGRQAALKARVRAVCREKSIPLREDYADPHALAELVLADLTAAAEAEFPLDQVPDAWTREDRDHEAYARSRRTRFYVGRDSYYDRLDAYARDGADGLGLLVRGESGSGKSALLANWVARRRQAHPKDFIFQHYIGSSPASASHLALMRRLMVAIIRWCGGSAARTGLGAEEEHIPAGAEEIEKAFPGYLDRLAAEAKRRKTRAVIVLDALNQLEDRERGRLLGWLPHRLPGELRLVTATLPGDTLDALKPRGWPELMVEPLTPEERVRLIAGYLEHFSQALSDARARRIAGVPAAANPLYLKTLLDDLRATGEHDRLDKQIADYLEAGSIPALLAKILARYESAYERDRPGLVKDALSLLWAARRGLTEPELLEALKPEGQERLPAAFWSPVRCALEDGLVDRDGVLAFAHEHLRKAVERKYVPGQEQQDEFRLQLADYFEAQLVNNRSCDELPWLLWQTESFVRLRACLLDIDRFLLIRDRDEEELRGYWVWLGEQKTMGKAYLESYKTWVGQPGRDDRGIAYAANQLGFFLHNAALLAEAEPLMKRVVTIFEKSFGPEHPNVATALNNLATLYKATNRLAEAEPLYKRALEIDEKSYGPEHPNVARNLNNLALLYQATNRLAEAEPLMKRALAIDEKSYGPEHPKVAIRLNNLAQLYQATNRLAEAEPLMKRALAIDEKSYGPEHPNVARNLNNLATLYKATNRLAEAEPLMQRALAIGEKSYGPEHPTVATALSNLATLYKVTNRLAEAEPLMKRALAIDEKSYGPEHPEVATDLNNLATLYKATNRLAEAEPLYKRALEIDEKSYGPEHPNVARNLNNLALLYQATNRLAEAEPLMKRALAIDEKSYGPEHPEVATDLNNLAMLFKDTNRLAEAEPLMKRALAIDEKSYGPEHPSVARNLNNLALLSQATSRLTEAEPLMKRVVTIFEKSYGADHPNVATALNNLAGLYYATNRLAEAEPLMKRALAIDEKSYGTDHPNVATALNNLALLFKATNRYAEAEPLMRRHLEIFLKFTRQTGHPHPHLQAAVSNYAALLSAMGRSGDEIKKTLSELGRRYGVNLGGK